MMNIAFYSQLPGYVQQRQSPLRFAAHTGVSGGAGASPDDEENIPENPLGNELIQLDSLPTPNAEEAKKLTRQQRIDRAPADLAYYVFREREHGDLTKIHALWKKLGLYINNKAASMRPIDFLNGIIMPAPETGQYSALELSGNACVEFSQLRPYRFVRSPRISPNNQAMIKGACEEEPPSLKKWLMSNRSQEAALMLLLRTGKPYTNGKNDPRHQDATRYVQDWLKTIGLQHKRECIRQRISQDVPRNYETSLYKLYWLNNLRTEDASNILNELISIVDKGIKQSPFRVLRSIPVLKEILNDLEDKGVFTKASAPGIHEKTFSFVERNRMFIERMEAKRQKTLRQKDRLLKLWSKENPDKTQPETPTATTTKTDVTPSPPGRLYQLGLLCLAMLQKTGVSRFIPERFKRQKVESLKQPTVTPEARAPKHQRIIIMDDAQTKQFAQLMKREKGACSVKRIRRSTLALSAMSSLLYLKNKHAR